MKMQLNIMDGNMDDIMILKNILDTYGIRSEILQANTGESDMGCLLYTSPSPRDCS